MYSVEQLANELNVSTRTIRNYLKEGKLKGSKIGGQWRFSDEDIFAFLGKSEPLILKSDTVTAYMNQIPKHNEGLVTLTFSLDSAAQIERIKDKSIAHFNSLYADNTQNRRFEYQLLTQYHIRITLIGPQAYILNFANWLTHYVELVTEQQ